MDSFEPRPGPLDGTDELDRLLEALEHGVMIVEKGRLIGVNRALARMAGQLESTLEGRRVSDLLADTDGRPVDEAGALQAARLRDRRGDLVPVSVRRVTPQIYLVIDHSREARLEREGWRLTEELREAERDEALPLSNEELLGMIEHEIRTATTVIRGYNRMLADQRVGPLNPSQHSFLVEVRRATDRISALLDNLLELASLDSDGGLRVVRRPVSLHAVVHAAAQAAKPLLEDRGMRLELDLGAEPDVVSADPASLEQVLLNLLTNAAKFAPEGSAVCLATARLDAPPSLSITVRDQGAGVGRTEAEEIFNPFVRGEAAATSPSSGVGLGLAICRRILVAHGGTIEALPNESGGVFRLTLPAEPER
jgi:signal transduction histidine kinase